MKSMLLKKPLDEILVTWVEDMFVEEGQVCSPKRKDEGSRQFQQQLEAFRSLLDEFGATDAPDKIAELAEVMCQLSRRIRLNLCDVPVTNNTVVLSKTLVKETGTLFRRACQLLTPVVDDSNPKLKGIHGNFCKRATFFERMLESKTIGMDDLS